jgi:polyhydroxybutyrate depolymerase
MILLLGNLLLAGCNTTSQQVKQASVRTPVATPVQKLVDRPVPTTGCGKVSPIKPGSSANQSIAVDPAVSNGNLERSYLVHVPTGYERTRPVAVVLAFHGHGGNAADEERGTGFSTLADQDGFLAVYPQGLPDGQNLPFWASDGPIDFGIDDALFVSNVLTRLQEDFCVDPRRIYATGFSNGGGMSGFLACKLAERIAAFAPVSGNYYALPDGCNPGRPVPVMEIHGTADPIVPYAGIPASESPEWPLPSIPQWLQAWANRDGCTQGPFVFLRIPAVTGENWTHCKGNATVVHYRIEGGGHSLPATIGGTATNVLMWQFFQSHPLPV